MIYDIIVIGGGPAGLICALNAKKNYPSKKILLIKEIGDGVIPCAIPYMIKTLKNCQDNALGDAALKNNNIGIEACKVIKINRKTKTLFTEKEELGYNKLVLATGSDPIIPPIPGIEKQGIYPIIKKMSYLQELKKEIKNSKNIVLVGGGFIGAEYADELSNLKGKNITIVEMQPRIIDSFDHEFSEIIAKELESKGVKILVNKQVTKFLGKEEVQKVEIKGAKIKADAVILGVGSKPNSKLAEEAGLKIVEKSIMVDGFQRTSDENIFAIGDCAHKKDLITLKQSKALLASSATTEARIAAKNLFKPMVENKGTLGIYSTKIVNTSMGSAGITEEHAKRNKLQVVVGVAKAPDKHPGKMPGTMPVHAKLVFSKKDMKLIGGEVLGGDSVGEIINIVGLAIQKQMTAFEIEILEIGTHPKLTPPPTIYPLITAAQDALSKK